jgi:hypothetical protein
MKQERYRVCAVCGKRHGPTYGFQAMLEGLGIKGTGLFGQADQLSRG